jgi:putative heme-binding domain-containing protein
MELREAAVKRYGKGWTAEENLLKMAKEGRLPKELNAAAAATLKSAIKGGVREEAGKLFNSSTTNTGANALDFAGLAKKTGQPKAGEKVFMQSCTICHQVGNKGMKFGPALTQIGGKLTKEALYTAIVEPDKGISFGYEGYSIKLKDGSEMGGIITSQTEDVVEVSSPGGAKTKIEKSKIASQTQMKGSMMPKGLEEAMSQQDLVNLVEYLYSLK